MQVCRILLQNLVSDPDCIYACSLLLARCILIQKGVKLCSCCTGLAVVWDMLLTTQFLTLVMLTVWQLPTPIAVCFHLFFSAIEATFFSACAEKVPTGALLHLHRWATAAAGLHVQVIVSFVMSNSVKSCCCSLESLADCLPMLRSCCMHLCDEHDRFFVIKIGVSLCALSF